VLLIHLVQRPAEPIQPLVKSVPRRRAACLNEPPPVPQVVQPQFVCHFRWAHRVRQVLLVRERQDRSVAKFILPEESVQFVPREVEPGNVGRVHDKYYSVDALVVVPPEASDLVLPTDVPYGEGDVFVVDLFDVEPYGRYGDDVWWKKDEGFERGLEREDIYC